MGDPAGVGPEICVKALQHQGIYEACCPIVGGDWPPLKAAADVSGLRLSCRRIRHPDDARCGPGCVNLIDLGLLNEGDVFQAGVSAAAGEAAYQYVVRSVRMLLSHEADALVTAPIHKEAIHLAGHHYAGHTELLAELTSTRRYTMMLAVGRLRVAHVSGHLSLRDACTHVRRDRVKEVILLADEAMRRIGIAEPRVAVAALNPHGGEAGLFGREEIEEIAPAIQDARQLGVNAEGPLPSDTLMAKAAAGGYDVAVAMYHDQGHIAVKFVGFAYDDRLHEWSAVRGVNITLGLPIIRTSVDHGTAFDIAGRGIASELSMLDAIDWAVALAGGDTCRIRDSGRQV